MVRAIDPPQTGLWAAIGMGGKLPNCVAVPISHGKCAAHAGPITGIPEVQPRQQWQLSTVLSNISGRGMICIKNRISTQLLIDVLGEDLRLLQRHPALGIVFLNVDGNQVIRSRPGKFKEVLGLFDRVARAAQMIGAPLQPKGFGQGFAGVVQFLSCRIATPAQTTDRIFSTVGPRPQTIGGLVDETGQTLIALDLGPIDDGVFIGIQHDGRIWAFPGAGKFAHRPSRR